MISGPATATSPGNMLEIQNLVFQPKSTEKETVAEGDQNSVFPWVILIQENHQAAD